MKTVDGFNVAKKTRLDLYGFLNQNSKANLPQIYVGQIFKQTVGLLSTTLSKLRHRRGLHGFLQSFGPGALVNLFGVVEMVVEAPNFWPVKKKTWNIWTLFPDL